MKKYLLLLLALPLFAACNDSGDNTDRLPDAEITVGTDKIDFPSKGGAQTITVAVENSDKWEAYSKVSWIELGQPDFEKGTLEITVAPTEEILDLSGEVVIYAGMNASRSITVSQKGHGVIHERSSLSRMGLKGDISELSHYTVPIYIWELNSDFMRNLRFDEHGMLTYFEHTHYFAPGVTGEFFINISYDQSQRITKIDATSDLIVDGTTTPFKFSFDFSYGNHGKYIETDRFFHEMVAQNAFGCYRLWAPRMIKDLTHVHVVNTSLTTDWDLIIKVDGDTGSGIQEYESGGQIMGGEVFKYTFENGYTKTFSYKSGFTGVLISFMQEYDVDPVSGYIRRITQSSPDIGGDGVTVEKTFFTDLANSMATYKEYMEIGYEMKIGYNENYDVVSIKEDYNVYHAEFDYDYDSHGNWIQAYTNDIHTAPVQPFDITRTITYRE